jgi:DmsE family decaheme c-type cytochrome
MTLNRGSKFLVFSFVAALAIVALAGNLKGLPAGAQAQQSGTTMQDCAACHEDLVKAFNINTHDILEKSPSYKVANPCESCHGPGKAHIEGGGDKTKIVTFKGKSTAGIYNQQCLTCHKKDHAVTGFNASTHARQGLFCADCHSIHKPAPLTRSLKDRASNLCMSCHTLQRAQFSKPFHHRVKENAMECTDCHQPHSGIDAKQVSKSFSGQEVCFKCHSEKQGPFVFEHPAINLRGCQGCHEPHGSNNPKLLNRSAMTALCLECHSRSLTAKTVITSQPPSFHNLNSPTYQNCTTCHVMIHGSNFDRLFFK